MADQKTSPYPLSANDFDGYFGDYGGQFMAETLMTAVLELEKSLTIYPWDSGYSEELDEARDEGWEAIDNMQEWKVRGEKVPRRFWETWEPRFIKVMLAQREHGGIGWGR